MSKFLHADNNTNDNDAKAIAIPRIYSENSRAENSNALTNGALILYQTTNSRLFQSERVCRRQFQI